MTLFHHSSSLENNSLQVYNIELSLCVCVCVCVVYVLWGFEECYQQKCRLWAEISVSLETDFESFIFEFESFNLNIQPYQFK